MRLKLTTINANSTALYIVQTNWPDSSRPERIVKFSSFKSSAYVSIDTPDQYLFETHPELFEGSADQECWFTEYEPAAKLAVFLREKGRLYAGWKLGGLEEWRKQYRGALAVRIIHEISTTHTILVEKE